MKFHRHRKYYDVCNLLFNLFGFCLLKVGFLIEGLIAGQGKTSRRRQLFLSVKAKVRGVRSDPKLEFPVFFHNKSVKRFVLLPLRFVG